MIAHRMNFNSNTQLNTSLRISSRTGLSQIVAFKEHLTKQKQSPAVASLLPQKMSKQKVKRKINLLSTAPSERSFFSSSAGSTVCEEEEEEEEDEEEVAEVMTDCRAFLALRASKSASLSPGRRRVPRSSDRKREERSVMVDR